MTEGSWWEKTVDGLRPVELRGRLVARISGIDVYEDMTLVKYPEAFQPADYLPNPPILAATQTTRTSVDISVTPQANPFPRTDFTQVNIYRSDDGGAFALVSTINKASDPGLFQGPILTTLTVPTNTPEIVFRFKANMVNFDGQGGASNEVQTQWAGTPPVQQPSQFTNFRVSNIGATTAVLNWDGGTSDTSITKCGIFDDGVLIVDNIPPNQRNYSLAGLQPNTDYTNLTVRRYNNWAGGNPQGWSNVSNAISFKTLVAPVVQSLFLGHVPGKLVLGWSTSHTEGSGAGTADTQLNTQTPFNPAKGAPSGVTYSSLLGVRRLYAKAGNQSVIDFCDAQNRILWISAKGDEFGASPGVPGWSQVASGSRDASIVSYFTSLVARNKLTIFTFHHEPIGDTNGPADGTTHCQAHQRIMQVVDANFGGKYSAGNPSGHKILFCPNYEENRLRNLKPWGSTGPQIDWSLWHPQNMMPGKGGPRPWDFMSWDIYQYGANTSTNVRSGVEFSHRWWRIDELYTGQFTPAGTTAMPYMRYTPGVDLVYGIGEGTQRPGAFYNFEQNNGGTSSNMPGAKYTRDMLDYIRTNINKFFCVSWFNSIGSDKTYNDERLWPDTATWGGDVPNHPSFVQQTGDTEYAINIYRELLNGGQTVKLNATTGITAGYTP